MMKQEQIPARKRSVPATQAYALGAFCLVLGLIAGYVARSSRAPAAHAAAAGSAPATAMKQGRMPSTADLKRMADQKAAPLFEELKNKPNNADLLLQIASVYASAHQFADATTYYGKAVEAAPNNLSARTKYSGGLYRSGDVDGALKQVNEALRISPNDANSLFNLGVMRWEGKHDAKGALAVWRQLLKTNPQLDPDRKAAVQHMITQVQASAAELPPGERNQKQ